MDDDHTQDNSVPGVPMILKHLANSYFKIGHQLSMIILHIMPYLMSHHIITAVYSVDKQISEHLLCFQQSNT